MAPAGTAALNGSSPALRPRRAATRSVASRAEDRSQLTRDLLPVASAADPDRHGTVPALLDLTAVAAPERQERRVHGHDVRVSVGADLHLLWRRSERVEGRPARTQVRQPSRARHELAARVDEGVLGAQNCSNRYRNMEPPSNGAGENLPHGTASAWRGPDGAGRRGGTQLGLWPHGQRFAAD
jgi:hypothetical protein